MTKVKICGITNLEDGQLSAKFGADALGFNFYEKSPRYILPEVAREIINEMPGDILKVGVFVNEDFGKIVEIAITANLDAIQLHGEETPEFAKELKTKTGLEIIKAFRVSEDFKPEDVLQYEVDAILLDAYSPKEHGGTGETFDWEIAKKVKEIFPKMYLAGGISHDNVITAIARINPIWIDACSQIEQQKGIKDFIKCINLISKAKYFSKIFPSRSYEESIKNCTNYIKPKLPSNVYVLLEAVQTRPEMYLGEKSLPKLQMFLMGIKYGLYLTDKKGFMSDFGETEYQQWMAKKVGYYYPNSFDCMTHIIRKYQNDEKLAFDYYFALLEEFKLEKNLTNE